MSASIAEDGHARHRDKTEVCDLCGDTCDGSSELCVFITCSRHTDEDDSMYHQNCVEKFLKKHGFQYNRKTGFPCPRGRGKATKFSEECKGKVDKSHPVIPKNEEKKKKAVAPPLAEVMAKQPKKEDKRPPAQARKINPPKPYVMNSANQVKASVRPPAVPRTNAWQNGAAQQAIRVAPPASGFAAPDPPQQSDEAEDTPHVPVGLVLEEAMSRAQKKNLQRRKKKSAALDAISEAPTDASADQACSLEDWPTEQQQQQAGAAAAAAAAGSSSGAGSSSAGSSSGGSGSAAMAQLLNGHNFVTDIKRYQQLLGMAFESSEEEDDSADVGDYVASDDAASALTAVPDSPPAPAAASPPPPAPPTATAATAPQDATGDDDAALRAAIEASERQYRLEQEQARQRAILAGAPAGMYGSYASEAGYAAPSPHAAADDTALLAGAGIAVPAASVIVPAVPVATPIVPVAVPAAVAQHKPVAVQVAAPPAAATATVHVAAHAGPGFNFIQQSQAQQPQFAAGFQYPSWQQQNQVQQKQYTYGGDYTAAGYTGGSGYPAAAPVYGAGYGGAAAMAAGYGVSAAPAGKNDDDDDLSSLLELCGVAG